MPDRLRLRYYEWVQYKGVFFALVLLAACGSESSSEPTDSGATVDATSSAPADAMPATADAAVALADAMATSPDGGACPSGGAALGDSCWYLGGEGESCDTVCAGVALVATDATRTFAGSDGTDENCNAVLDALQVPNPGFVEGQAGYGGGCTYNQSFGSRIRWATPATANDAGDSSNAPACACE